MSKTKKTLSVLMALLILIGTMATSSLFVQSADLVYAHKFKDSQRVNYEHGPGDYTCEDGTLRMQSSATKFQQQHQMMFSVDSDMMYDAVSYAQDEKTGLLAIGVTVNSCINAYGNEAGPEIVVRLIATNGSTVATIQNYQSVGTSLLYTLDVSGETALSIKSIYVGAQYYALQGNKIESETGHYGCADLDVTFSSVYVYDQTVATTLPAKNSTTVDANRTTFFNFRANAKKDYNNYPDTIMYSPDGSTYYSEGRAKDADQAYDGYVQMKNINFKQQSQLAYSFSKNEDDARNALAIANGKGGTGKLKMDVYVADCADNAGKQTICEIQILMFTKADASGFQPDAIQVSAWQIPQTHVTYYLDVSKITDFSQLNYISVRAQNYWYYNKEHQLVDLYSNDEKAAELGFTKCQIMPTVCFSPITVAKSGATQNVGNFYLETYNKTGSIPSVIPDPFATTTTAVKSLAKTTAKATLTGVKAAKVSWNKVTNAKYYEIYRAVGSGSYKYLTKTTKLYYTNSGLAAGKKYSYKVRAVNGTVKASFSAAKSVTTMKYTSVATIKSLAKYSKAFKLTLKSAVTGAKGYQVQYSLKSNFKSAKAKAFTGKTVKISKLKAKKKYYVRVRAFNKVNNKNKYSKWSKAKTVVTK